MKYTTTTRRKHLKGRVEVLVNKYAPWYDLFNTKNAIYRGVKHSDKRMVNKDIYLINSSEHNRVSIDTNNIHNLIIDNSADWSEYPKRSKSLVCTTNPHYAQQYGEIYRVIPLLENTKVAIAPRYDIITSFHRLEDINDEIVTLKYLERYLSEVFILPEKTFKSYNELKSFLTKENFNIDNHELSYRDFLLICEEYGSFIKYVESYMTPSSNGFKLQSYNQSLIIGKDNEICMDCKPVNNFYNAHHLLKGNEVWMDCDCIMVKESYIRNHF